MDSRSYSTNIIRPKPEVQHDSDNLVIVTTPWGSRDTAKKTQQLIADYFLSSNDDQETTSPFPKLSCISATANNLRIATMLANDVIYRELNRDEYLTGVEVFAGSRIEHDFVFIQVGQPHVLLYREGLGVHPISIALDLSFDVGQSSPVITHPLPKYLLGTDPTINLTVGSFKPRQNDTLILLSRTHLPNTWKNLSKTPHLDLLVQMIAQDDPESPFWIGTIHF